MDDPRSDGAVAIVGYSHRLPGGLRTDDDFWRLLSERETVREPVTGRYGRGYRPIGEFSGPGRFASAYEGLIRDEGEKLFDRGLFGMSHHEMLSADPHVRMLLTCTWEACEQAGWDLASLRNSRTGVFVGAQVPATSNWRRPLGATEFSIASISVAMLANRISYHFNLMGPSLACCTACSASLTALHTALNALRSGDCEQAFVASANYLGSARLSTGFNALGVISPDGRCHSFDAEANGYMRSEGAFVFAIKPLAAAERDGDPIHAVVEATAINAAGAADGAPGLAAGRYITAPTRHAQVDLMRAACARAGREPREFDYVEAHATGTVVGDRIEGNAIAEAFGDGRDAPLRVASVKSNVGHMEAAAFTAALHKVVLMMRRRTFAPVSKNYVVPNPDIDFDSCPMLVQTACDPFPDRPVLVGINSFGFGGSNGHCVVREYRPESRRIWSVPLAGKAGFMVPLSARTSGALEKSARALRETLERREMDLYTLAGNLSRRRTHFATRTSFAVRTRDELIEALRGFERDPTPIATADPEQRRIAMVFSGQGTQWAGCGRALYDADPVFRRVVDVIEDHWREHSARSLREACFSAPQEALDEVQLAQPVIFMLQCALVELFKTWGVYPECVVGHSSGEVAAAYASGALSLAEATRLVFHRATLQQRTAGSGRMLAIGLDRPGVEALLESLGVGRQPATDAGVHVEIACENAPASTVVCGREAALRSIMEGLDRRNVQHGLIPGNVAFHSSAMDPIREDALAALRFLDDGAFDADVPMVSSVTGVAAQALDADYWWSNIRRPVRFAQAMETVVRNHRPDVILEIAPHCALQPMIAQCLEGDAGRSVSIPTLMRDTDASRGFHEALGALFRAGVHLDFAAQYPRPEPIGHLLPGYPRDDQSASDDMSDDEMFLELGEYAHGPLIGHRVPCEHPLFEARLSESDFPWLAEHRVHHASIMPAAGYIELLLQAFEGVPLHVETLEFLQPCPIPKTPVRLQTELFPVANAPDEFTFTISSRSYEPDARSELHSRGTLRLVTGDHPVNAPPRLADIDTTGFEPYYFVGESDFYERIDASLGETFQYGPCFRTIKRVLWEGATADYLFDVEMDERLWTTGRDEGYVANPALLDGGLQIFLYHLLRATDIFAMPRRARGVTFLRPPTGPRLTCYVKKEKDWADVNELGQFTERRGERSGGSIRFYDSDTGDLVACIDAYVSFNSNPRWNDLPRSKHVVSWQPKFVAAEPPLTQVRPDGEFEPSALVAALERPGSDRRACHVIEFAGGRPPEETILNRCLDSLDGDPTHTEFWVIGETEEHTRAHYEAFQGRETALRFVSLDLAAEPAADLDTGLLRPHAAEMLWLHEDAAAFGPEQWRLLRRLAVPGGLALVVHGDGRTVEADGAWTTVHAGRRSTLLRARDAVPDPRDPRPLPGPRWVIGAPDSPAAEWLARLGDAEAISIPYGELEDDRVGTLAEWPAAADLRAIDIFCGADPGDPTGQALVTRLMAFFKALIPFRVENARGPCRVTLVTRRAVMDVAEPRASAVWGAIRSLGHEIAADFGTEAAMDLRLVDVGGAEDLTALRWLGECDLRERELAIRSNRVWAPRLLPVRERSPLVAAGEESTYRLTLDNPGQIGGLQMKTYEPASLGPRDVEIEVAAAALNFRDVMVTLGMLPALSYERSALGRTVGMEASGVVRRVGSGVRTCRVGDEVAFTQGGCIANRVVVRDYLVFPKPRALSLEEAASALSVYVTAYYSLLHLARLRAGQRVLIHSAMGGVGQAAIALAKHAGAEIYATAGSESKREQLLALGVRAAFDSHGFDWYEGVMEATGGEGVQVVLNSLAGHHLALCLKALQPGGWHCEIGKVDIYADNALQLSVFRKNLRFAAIDIDRLMSDDPELARELSQECLDLLERGAVPPLPMTSFGYGDYASALRLMTTGRHTGKLVLEAPRDSGGERFPIVDLRPYLDPEATYLVTGALGGFGRLLLPYLAAAGARHVTLMDRDPERRRSDDWVRKTSALWYLTEAIEIDIVSGDVALEEDVRRCVQALQRPLKGVFHLAGALDDCLLADLTPESLDRIFAPKARGALNLHRATADCPLDHFVLFSSVASTFGNVGQINYSAANGFLDGLAAFRRREGLPALSYNLAAVAEAGMASRNLHVLRLARSSGMPPVSADFAITNLDYAMRRMGDREHLITAVFSRPPLSLDSPDYLRTGRLLSNPDAFSVEVGGQLTLDTVVAQIAAKVAELCGHEEGGPEEPLSSFGLTSISVAELGAFIRMEFNFQVSALELMTEASALSLAQDIIHGKKEVEEKQADRDETGLDTGSAAGPQRARRRPSAFASALEDHFPQVNRGASARDPHPLRSGLESLEAP